MVARHMVCHGSGPKRASHAFVLLCVVIRVSRMCLYIFFTVREVSGVVPTSHPSGWGYVNSAGPRMPLPHHLTGCISLLNLFHHHSKEIKMISIISKLVYNKTILLINKRMRLFTALYTDQNPRA